MKKRDFFTVLAVGVAAAAAVQILHRWLRRDPEDDYDDYEDEILEDEALEDETPGDMMSQSYDEGFADGLNADYRGSNIAAQALQAEVEELLAQCDECCCNDEDSDEFAETGVEAGDPEET